MGCVIDTINFFSHNSEAEEHKVKVLVARFYSMFSTLVFHTVIHFTVASYITYTHAQKDWRGKSKGMGRKVRQGGRYLYL